MGWVESTFGSFRLTSPAGPVASEPLTDPHRESRANVERTGGVTFLFSLVSRVLAAVELAEPERRPTGKRWGAQALNLIAFSSICYTQLCFRARGNSLERTSRRLFSSSNR
jgi:hypothetical protein